MKERAVLLAICVAGWWISSNHSAHATDCARTSIAERFDQPPAVSADSTEAEEVAQLESVEGVVLLQVFVQASVCLDAPTTWPLTSPWALGPCAEVP